MNIDALDEDFQKKVCEMLGKLGRNDEVVGWYHSHPGFGCWLSSHDLEIQKVFEKKNPRSVAVVIDPIQSVKGKPVSLI